MRRLSGLPRLFRFALAGGGGFLVDSGALLALTGLFALDPYSGRICSFLVAATFTWYANRIITYPDRRSGGLLGEWGRFLIANTGGAALNLAAYSLVTFLAGTAPESLVLAVAAGSIAGLGLNYTLSSRFVFRR